MTPGGLAAASSSPSCRGPAVPNVESTVLGLNPVGFVDLRLLLACWGDALLGCLHHNCNHSPEVNLRVGLLFTVVVFDLQAAIKREREREREGRKERKEGKREQLSGEQGSERLCSKGI
jgi:hypothetical protein